ncbi:MAG: hypothetical protein KDA75_09920 [Planctomycetaceae bacterium]|nr:hypothetical protein [Planctomycetaceae bacterium]
MNYFAHALPFLDADPYFLAGTAVPDWMAVADRPVRVRAKLAAALAEVTDSQLVRSVAEGALRHLRDDDWFHTTRGFAEVTGQLTRLFRECLGPDDSMRCSFLGHVVTELLLDSALIERQPSRLDRYYDRLLEVDPAQVERSVNQMARGETERLKLLIPLFIRERFLYDYAEDAPLLTRLNAVLQRVKLTVLPDAVLDVLAAGRRIVRDRVRDLLTSEHYPFPLESLR